MTRPTTTPAYHLEIDLPATFAACRQMTRKHAKSFFFSSFLLPREKRNAAYAVYCFCRCADDLIDHVAPGGERAAALAALRDLLKQVYDAPEDSQLRETPFALTVHRYHIPQRAFTELLDGMAMDLACNRYADFAALQHYCYHVASTVGIVMSTIFGSRDAAAVENAKDLGTAMQLTNILRDIADDYRMGRVYLPIDELQQFGYTENDIRYRVMDERFIALMKFQIERARRFYERARLGIPALPDDGSRMTVILMERIYGGILEEIERNGYDVYSKRRRVHFSRKLRILVSTLINPVVRRRYAAVAMTVIPVIEQL